MAEPVRKATNPEIERQRDKQREITFKTIETEHEKDLVDRRQACSTHSLYRGNQMEEAKGNPMPSAAEECLKVLDVTARRGLDMHLYMNLALQAQGRLEYETKMDDLLLAKNEDGRTFSAITKASMNGEKTYLSIREDLPIEQKTKKIECPLALDAGFTYTNSKKNAVLPTLTPASKKAVIDACYTPDSPEKITVDAVGIGAVTMPLNKAGFLAGENIGRETRLRLAAENVSLNNTGSISLPPKATESTTTVKTR